MAHCKAAGLSWQDAINGELDFLRGWGLPTPRYGRRLEEEAKRRGAETSMDLVGQYIWRAAASFPQARARPSPQYPSRVAPLHIRLTGPNDAFVMHHSDIWHIDYGAALNRSLDFCRNYGLSPDLSAALWVRARSLGNTVRDEVRRILMAAAEGLPDGDPGRSSASRRQ